MFRDFTEDKDCLTGSPRCEEIEIPVDECTEEEAREFARARKGEYLGTIVKHRILVVKRTSQEIRESWLSRII